MTQDNDGGPAFPIETTSTPYAPGMSLRDWFAGQAMMGLIALGNVKHDINADELSKASYVAADAMLEARK